MTDALVQFLHDRLDEDERQARAAMTYAAAAWFIETSGIVTTGPDDDVYTDDREVAEHIARHDPARVLRDVEAKRAVVEQYEQAGRYATTTWGQSNADQSRARTLRKVARLLALPYSDHPDYQDAWRP